MSTGGMASTVRIGVDIGGTFTDVVVVDQTTGEVRVAKVPTVPADPSEGFMDGLEQAFRNFGIDPGAVAFTVHGTTVATNTIIQGKGARAGLITSAGFSDVLEIAYQTRPTLYEINYEKPAPLIARNLSIGVKERIGPDGEVVVPLDEADVAAAALRLRAAGVEAIAIAFLHAYRDPTHERRAASIIREACPGLPVILSSDVCPEYREYPRTSTTVVNAVLVPRVGPYIARLEERLAAAGLRCGLHLMTSSGGITASNVAQQFPVHLVESGPAAGVIGAAFVAQMTSNPQDFGRVLSLDIGGTTAKAALVDGGKPALADEFEVGAAAVPTTTASRGQGYPVKTPVISLIEIGAGGGSIAQIDPGGALTVGPESAGADPGPACYGKGGDRPTVTDANLVLGRLNPDYFLGGALQVDRARAEAALMRDVGRPLGLDLLAAARAVIDIANAKMVAALQFISIQRGLDPREYTLVPSGGAGPMHAVAIAAALGVRSVLVPPTPGLNSALGLLATDVKHDFVRTQFTPTRKCTLERIEAVLGEMGATGRRLLEAERVDPARVEVIEEAELCYVGQSYPLRIRVPADRRDVFDRIEAEFHRLHRELYGFASPSEATMIVNLRVTAIGKVDRPRLRALVRGDGDPGQALKGRRRVDFGGVVDCPLYERARLDAGDRIAGPAIIEQMDTTIVLPPAAVAAVDVSGCLIITLAS
ncbi:MAG: hydantoinase/oxoprolinase family protein [Alphaproteobacteria bacterium]|nr:hydantoinase/oxoprolinase family protein [Alphaproteobacteria bacterium]